jgi:hypothetical protein
MTHDDIEFYICMATALEAVPVSFLGFFLGRAAPVRLVGFTLETHTINDDKDHDTGIFVEIIGNAGQFIGYIEHAQSSDDDSMHYNHGEYHAFHIDPLRPSIFKDDCTNFQWRMGIQAAAGWFNETTIGIDGTPFEFHGGNDRWTFDAWLTVVFDDDTSIGGDKLGQTLESNNRKLVWDDFSGRND